MWNKKGSHVDLNMFILAYDIDCWHKILLGLIQISAGLNQPLTEYLLPDEYLIQLPCEFCKFLARKKKIFKN